MELVVLGCLHATLEEIGYVAEYLDGARVAAWVDLWIWTPYALKAQSERMGYKGIIESAGGRI